MSLIVFLVGQPELLTTRTAFSKPSKNQIVGRFMVSTSTFRGLRSKAELRVALTGYDEGEWPAGSGIPERDDPGDVALAEVACWLCRGSRPHGMLGRALLVNSDRLDLRHANPAVQSHRWPRLGRLPRLWQDVLGEEVPAALLVGSTLEGKHYRVYHAPIGGGHI